MGITWTAARFGDTLLQLSFGDTNKGKKLHLLHGCHPETRGSLGVIDKMRFTHSHAIGEAVSAARVNLFRRTGKVVDRYGVFLTLRNRFRVPIGCCRWWHRDPLPSRGLPSR